MNRTTRAIVISIIAVILVLGGFAGGLLTARLADPTALTANLPDPTPEKSALADQVTEVQKLLEDEALVPPNETSMTAGALEGMLEATGDKYALYLNPKHYKYFNEQTMGEFGGIGVLLGEDAQGAYVVEVYPKTPAAKAGIKSGDIFVSVDGEQRKKWTTEEVVKRVRGKEGTKVTVVLKRKGEKKPLTFDMTRAMIEYPNVDTKMYGDVGYVRMGSFNVKSEQELTEAFGKLKKQGAKAYVLDLRDNPGGLLESAINVSSLFVPNGVIVRVEERGKDPIEHRATGRRITDAPMVVLMNGNSASASEITAGALQDYGRAKLVGEKSFGKGSVQTVKQLADGGAVKYTIAHYLTPKNRAINGKGLQPDVVVKMKVQLQGDPKKDTQLLKALAVAKGEIQ